MYLKRCRRAPTPGGAETASSAASFSGCTPVVGVEKARKERSTRECLRFRAARGPGFLAEIADPGRYRCATLVTAVGRAIIHDDHLERLGGERLGKALSIASATKPRRL